MGYGLALTADGDFPIRTRRITGDEYRAQRARTRLQTEQGEWILGVAQGLPWLRWLQARPFPEATVLAAVRRELLEIDGVTRVEDVKGTFTPNTATYDVSLTLYTVDGEVEAALQVGGRDARNRVGGEVRVVRLG